MDSISILIFYAPRESLNIINVGVFTISYTSYKKSIHYYFRIIDVDANIMILALFAYILVAIGDNILLCLEWVQMKSIRSWVNSPKNTFACFEVRGGEERLLWLSENSLIILLLHHSDHSWGEGFGVINIFPCSQVCLQFHIDLCAINHAFK